MEKINIKDIQNLEQVLATYQNRFARFPTAKEPEYDAVMSHMANIVYRIEPEYLKADAIDVIEHYFAHKDGYVKGTFTDYLNRFGQEINDLVEVVTAQ
jgi:hypothetical protein